MTRFDRLLVHYKSIVVVGDLIASAGGVGDTVTYVVHNRGGFSAINDPSTYVVSSPCGESMMSGANCVNSNMARGKMFHATVLPLNQTLRGKTGYTGRGCTTLPGSGLEFDVSGTPSPAQQRGLLKGGTQSRMV